MLVPENHEHAVETYYRIFIYLCQAGYRQCEQVLRQRI